MRIRMVRAARSRTDSSPVFASVSVLPLDGVTMGRVSQRMEGVLLGWVGCLVFEGRKTKKLRCLTGVIRTCNLIALPWNRA